VGGASALVAQIYSWVLGVVTRVPVQPAFSLIAVPLHFLFQVVVRWA